MKHTSKIEHSKLQENYEKGLEAFIQEIREDKQIIAAFLFGSLVDGDVWEKSDLDIVIITKDEQTTHKDFWLMSDYFLRSIQLSVISRNHFKRLVERSLHSSWLYHVITTSKVLFCDDTSIKEYYEDVFALGSRDVEIQLLQMISMVTGDLEKAEKFFYYKQDLAQSYLFITKLLDRFAQIIVLLNNDIPSREVILQATKYEPVLIQTIFNDVIMNSLDSNQLETILTSIRNYLIDNTPRIYRPVLEYLKEAEEYRSNSDLVYHLNKLYPSDWWAIAIDGIGQWLSEQKYVAKVPSPVRLTRLSRMEMMETGYIYTKERDV